MKNLKSRIGYGKIDSKIVIIRINDIYYRDLQSNANYNSVQDDIFFELKGDDQSNMLKALDDCQVKREDEELKKAIMENDKLALLVVNKTKLHQDILVYHKCDAVRLALVHRSVDSHIILHKDENKYIRLEVAKISAEYHSIMYNDDFNKIRLLIASMSSDYHDKVFNDKDINVRIEVAKASTLYHDILCKDDYYEIRRIVASMGEDYHNILCNDNDWEVLLAVLKGSGNKYIDKIDKSNYRISDYINKSDTL